MNTAWTHEFDPPAPPHTERIRIQPLEPSVVELDFAAIMGSRVRLRAELQWGKGWPRDDFTVGENRKDLASHHGEFERREAYAYTVLDRSGEVCVGCIYIESWEQDMRLAFWVIDDEIDTGLEAHLLAAVLRWVESDWPFDRVLVPLRAANERGIRVARSLGLVPLDEGGLPDHENLVWSRPVPR